MSETMMIIIEPVSSHSKEMSSDGQGGEMDVMGYQNYFITTALIGIPVLFLIIYIAKVAPVK